jgi:hypothetical protein
VTATNGTQALVQRCWWALVHHQGHPCPDWSGAQQLAVALVLRDRGYLAAMGYTPQQAAGRVLEDMADPPADLAAWLAGIRAQLIISPTVVSSPPAMPAWLNREQVAAADRRLRRTCLELPQRAALAELLTVLVAAVRKDAPVPTPVQWRLAEAIEALAGTGGDSQPTIDDQAAR